MRHRVCRVVLDISGVVPEDLDAMAHVHIRRTDPDQMDSQGERG
jgi:hypothetical protein